MLNNFNKLIKSLLFEQVQDTDEEKEKIMAAYNTNEFYTRVLEPIAIDSKVQATKQRNNTYLISGPIGDVCKFFSNLKVDKDYMDDPKEFRVYSPLITTGDVTGKLKLDQFYPLEHIKRYGVPTTHEIENITGEVLEGHWYSLRDPENKELLAKGMKPSEVSTSLRKIFTKKIEQLPIYVEFQVNTEKLKNMIWDEMSEYAKNPDEMNDFHNSDPDDFDYTQLNIKNENDEAVVKSALKDIKRTSKEYKENKLK